MQKSPSEKCNHSSSATHQTLQKSATLNRHYVHRPTSYYEEVQAARLQQCQELAARINRERLATLKQFDPTEEPAPDTYAQSVQVHITPKTTTPLKIAVSDLNTSTLDTQDLNAPIHDTQDLYASDFNTQDFNSPVLDTQNHSTQESQPSSTNTPIVETPEVAAITHFARQVAYSPESAPIIAPEPTAIATSEFTPAASESEPIAPVEYHPLQAVVRERTHVPESDPLPTAQELKERAINEALAAAAAASSEPAALQSLATDTISQNAKATAKAQKAQAKLAKKQAKIDAKLAKKQAKRLAKAEKDQASLERSMKKSRRLGRLVFAFTTATACVAALGFFIYSNAPDLSVRVAAMQTGIDAAYPSYVPRDYQLASVSTGEDNSIIMVFNGPDGVSFTLTEQKSSWDSTTLLNNYVKPTWNEDYDTLREQGITIYTAHSDAVWVNGGMVYSIDASANNLTKKQIKNIVTSL